MALTMIDPASSWLEVVELPTITRVMTKKVNGKERTIKEEIFDKSSDRIARLVNKIWLCRYPRCRYLIYGNGSEFKLHFETLCDSYGIKRKPTTIKNPQANAICERVHQVLGTMMHTAELDMADSVHPADIDTFIQTLRKITGKSPDVIQADADAKDPAIPKLSRKEIQHQMKVFIHAASQRVYANS
jgi:hypothetical protein